MRARVPDGAAGSGSRAQGFEKLLGTRYRHPLGIARAHDAAFRLYFARHATLEAGTGLVHTAPGHGADDYVVGRQVGLPIYAPVDGAGKLTADVADCARPAGVFDANPKIVARLADTGFLLNKPGQSVRHQYPHCWRCKTPIVFRATEQWFARIGAADDPTSLRAEALAEIGKTQWIPSWGENRIRGMIEARPDWCLSRQRVWGVPIPAFRCANCGKDLLDPDVMEHVAEIFLKEGSNAWFTWPARELVPPGTGCSGCGSRDSREAGRHRRRLVRVGRLVGRGRRGQAGRRRATRSTSTSRARTSTAAGSTRRC